MISTRCTCGRRPEPHEDFDDFLEWLLFLAANGLAGKKILASKLATPGESAKVDWDSIRLWALVLREQWHQGSIPTDPDQVRILVEGEGDTPFQDFAFSWERVRARLEWKPGTNGELWLPRLEALRRETAE